MWGELAASAGQAAGSMLQDVAQMGIQSAFNAQAASKSWDRQKNLMTRGPTYQMQGLRDAGLNPILAAQGGFAKGGSAPQQSATGLPSGGAQRSLLSAQLGNIKEQTRAAGAQADINEAQARLARIAALIAEDPEVINAAKQQKINESIPDNPTQAIIKEFEKFRRNNSFQDLVPTELLELRRLFNEVVNKTRPNGGKKEPDYNILLDDETDEEKAQRRYLQKMKDKRNGR